MSQHDHNNSHRTQIIVKEIKEISSGRRPNSGEHYTMYQLIATKPDGTVIDLNLRTFDEIPTNEVVDVHVTPFNSERYGTSYTIKPVGKTQQQSQLEEVMKRLRVIEERLGIQAPGTPPLTPQGAPPVTPPPPVNDNAVAATPPAQQPAPQQQPSDDIPF